MIYAPLTSFVRSSDMALAVGAAISENGQALVNTIVNGKEGVQPSTGAAGEVFVGFAALQTSAAPVLPTTVVRVEELVVPASGTIALAKTPLTGTVHVAKAADQSTVTIVGVTANVVDVGAANADLLVRVTYRSVLTVAEARAKVGDIQPGGYSGNSVGQVGVGQQGVIYTSTFDTSKDWSAATDLKLGANGVLTQGGTGSSIKAVILHLPSVDYPFLGLRFNAEV